MESVKWPLGLSTCSYGYVNQQVFRDYSNAEIPYMEISLSLDDYNKINYTELLQYSKDYNVKIWSFHLPFYPFETNNIASIDKQVRTSSIEKHLNYIQRISDIGIQIAVIHPSGEPNPDSIRKEMLRYAQESLSILADQAYKYGVTIAVENLPRTCIGNCSKEILYLTESNDKLKVCFDLNHSLFENNISFIQNVNKKIVTIHVSDYDLMDEKHWLPYEGKNDWIRIVEELEKVNYCGPFMYEVPMKSGPKNNGRRDLTLNDFKDNYISCINKKIAESIK